MDSKFNNRLAGTMIIIALGIIVLPSLLHSNKNIVHDKFVAIPLAPELNNNKREISYLANHNQKLPSNSLEKNIVKSQIDQPQAWVVQLGALKNAPKVLEIVDQLRLSGYSVYTLPSIPVEGQITRIFVGPDTSKKKLQLFLKELNQLSALNGQLYPYIDIAKIDAE
ncbi:sporulation protein [Candidatus Palibaumannia cicadellinicola]|uniref:Sporulation protein n=1 Tax=Candidatus Palibaumannia cicadellinicola TaxID=186490 RepID=A0A2N4XXI5_9GAMM|nr:SPOR domain-containing protein [Candidatus Baumannia cicadellinicola]PLK59200.1 sporulation protein [Candidatus Baumannia cicadellinicola]